MKTDNVENFTALIDVDNMGALNWSLTFEMGNEVLQQIFVVINQVFPIEKIYVQSNSDEFFIAGKMGLTALESAVLLLAKRVSEQFPITISAVVLIHDPIITQIELREMLYRSLNEIKSKSKNTIIFKDVRIN